MMVLWPMGWETSGKFLKGKLVALNSLFSCSLVLERGSDAYGLALTLQLRTIVQGKAEPQRGRTQ